MEAREGDLEPHLRITRIEGDTQKGVVLGKDATSFFANEPSPHRSKVAKVTHQGAPKEAVRHRIHYARRKVIIGDSCNRSEDPGSRNEGMPSAGNGAA